MTTKNRVLWLVASAQVMIAVDSTVMNIALPTIQAELGFSDTSRHWVITAYALAFGALLLPGARVGARLGARRALVWGGLLFAGASLLGGFSGTFEVLLAGRALQGVAAALVAPASLTALSVTFPSGPSRVRAFGVYGAIGIVGTAAGLFLGGPLTQFLTWRSPMALLAVLAGCVMLGAFRLTGLGGGDVRALPWLSAFLSTAALFALVLSLSLFESAGPLVASLVLGAGLLLLLAFVTIERRAQDPLLAREVFTSRLRLGALAVLGIGSAGLFSVFLFVVYFLQGPLQFGPVASSFAILPFPAVTTVSAVLLAPRLVRRFGPRIPLVFAGALAAAGMGWITIGAADASYLKTLLPGIIATAAGMGIIFAIAPDSATAGLSSVARNAGSSLVHVVQQIGGAVGIAVLAFIASFTGTVASSASYQLVFGATALTFLMAAVAAAVAFWAPARAATGTSSPSLRSCDRTTRVDADR